MKKQLIIFIVILSIATYLIAQVQFQQISSIDKLNPSDYLENIELLDYNNDGNQEIVAQYSYSYDVWKIIIYDIYGDTLEVKQFEDYYPNHYSLFNKDNQNYLLVTGGFDNQMGFIIKDFETLATIDSISVDIVFGGINDIKYTTYSTAIHFLIGYTVLGLDVILTNLCSVSFENDMLTFIENYYDGGLSFTIVDEGTILTTGSYSLFCPPFGSVLGFSLHKLTIGESMEELHSIYGSYNSYPTHIYNNYPGNYVVLSQNNIGLSLQVLHYFLRDTQAGNSVHFKGYDTSTRQLLWTKTDTQIGLENITASTCVKVNDEDHYVMYFRGDKLEIRNRVTGNIVHHQDSVLAVCEILKKSDGELLFFVEKDDETGYDVYSLDGPIFVSNDEPPSQNEFFIEQYPNPFRNQITFSFTSKEPIHKAEIKVYNIKGQLIITLSSFPSPSLGTISAKWNGKDKHGQKVSPGVYLYQLLIDGEQKAERKCLLIE